MAAYELFAGDPEEAPSLLVEQSSALFIRKNAEGDSGVLRLGHLPVQRRRPDRLDDMFIEHDPAATHFWANFKALMDNCVAMGPRA